MPKKEHLQQEKLIVPAVEVDPPQFNFILIVINPFGDYKKGQRINDNAEIKAVIDAGKDINCNCIIRN